MDAPVAFCYRPLLFKIALIIGYLTLTEKVSPTNGYDLAFSKLSYVSFRKDYDYSQFVLAHSSLLSAVPPRGQSAHVQH